MSELAIPLLDLGPEIGRGGQSVVFRGRKAGRAVAVKVPLARGGEGDRDAAYRRFLREAGALARIRNPALPAIFEVGQADGVPYLVMDLIQGRTLADHLVVGPVDEREVISLGLVLAGALDSIHASGLVHRDVKPQNVVMGDDGTVHLIDLGFAALAGHTAEPFGTRAYAAPEVVAGTGRPVDARADLYSLGCVLREALGEARSQPPTRLEDAGAHDLRQPLQDVLAKLLAKDPAQRYGSARAVVRDLSRISGAQGGVEDAGAAIASRVVGRTGEFERLRRAFAEAQRGGAVVVVEGAAGTGKTCLLRAFASQSADAGVPALSATCHPRDPRAFSAARQLIESYLAWAEDLPPPGRQRERERFLRIVGDLGPLLRLVSPAVAFALRNQSGPPILASENAEQAFVEGLGEFLGRLLSDLGPLVVTVDGVEWLDSGSRRVLSRALSGARAGRTLFAFGTRTGEGVAPLLVGVDLRVTRIELSALSFAEVTELARTFLAADGLEQEIEKVLHRLSDGTPLNVLDVLRALSDEGAIVPHWGTWRVDAAALQRMRLPTEAASLLRRRIGYMGPPSRDVLSTAAVIGPSFQEDLLRKAIDGDGSQVSLALLEGKHHELVEEDKEGSHRFIHSKVREVFLEELEPARLSEIHMNVAVALDALTASSPRGGQQRDDADFLYRVAYHYANGTPGVAGERASRAALSAAEAAFMRFDNGRAVEYFEAAEGALRLLGRSLTPSDRLLLAEARLRVGDLDDALRELGGVLAEATEQHLQVAALTRAASVHDLRYDTVRAWDALVEAFLRVGVPVPDETPGYAAGSFLAWLRRRGPRARAGSLTGVDRLRDEALCALYYQAGRVAHSSGKPLRIALAAVRALEPAERLGPSAALAKSYLVYSFVLTVLGFSSAGVRYLSEAERIARALGDPVVVSHALQVHAVIAAWGGRVQDAIDAASKCLLEYGKWRELNEFCMLAFTVQQIEAVRGRDLEAWRWIEVAVQRVNRQEGRPILHELLLLGARAALSTIGRSESEGLLHQLGRATVRIPRDSDIYASTFGPRIRVLTDQMDFTPAFDAIVSEFAGLRQDPKRAHIGVSEYYLHLAHARVNQCLRADERALPRYLVLLDAARDDLDAASRIPLLRAHALAVTGYSQWFHGKVAEALAAFERAAEVARAENAPWVTYAVHRGRAHVLRAEGNAEAARDQAVLAESIAIEHGAVFRARWVREEFGLRPRRGVETDDLGAESGASSLVATDTGFLAPAGKARRQLRALLRISQARAQELDPDHQARLVVDELVQALRAERGFLLLTPRLAGGEGPRVGGPAEKDGLEVVAGRDLTGRDLGGLGDHDVTTLEQGFSTSVDVGLPRGCPTGTTPRLAAIAAPLVVDDAPAGVIYLDRSLSEGVFTDADGEVLLALAGQVAIALELARSLHLRERAQEDTLSARKMDAVARLAGGIAHDLNNMLSSIKYATAGLLMDQPEGAVLSPELQIIQTSERRAGELTKQLMAFSRGDFGRPELVRLDVRLDRLLPVFQGVVGPRITVEARPASDTGGIVVDPGQIDQVLMNLVVNARDALPEGGSVLIETSDVVLDETYRRTHPRVAPGRYVRISVQDTGHGMQPDVLQKVFEPYFTTKGERGTGLGLANVYWIVQHAGGHIDATSTPGVGTTFTIHFPRFEGTVPGERGSVPSSQRVAGTQRNTVLLVQDDPTAAAHLETSLARLGYRVLTARTPGQATELLRRNVAEVVLVVTDVLLAGMNGLELSRELRELGGALPVLFVAGDTGGILADRGIAGERVEFMPRLAPMPLLTRRVRDALKRR